MIAKFFDSAGKEIIYEMAYLDKHGSLKIKAYDIITERGIIPNLELLRWRKTTASEVTWGTSVSIVMITKGEWNLQCSIGDCMAMVGNFAYAPRYWRLGGFKTKLELNKYFSQPSPLP